MARLGLNIILFQVGWFSLVLGTSLERSREGWLVFLMVLAGQVVISRCRLRDLVLMSSAGLCGWLAESLLARLGLYTFGGQSAAWAPLWLGGLWVNFGATPFHSLQYLLGRPWLAAALGAIAGPLAYWGGSQLGAIELASRWTLPVLALFWAFSTAAVFSFAELLRRRFVDASVARPPLEEAS